MRGPHPAALPRLTHSHRPAIPGLDGRRAGYWAGGALAKAVLPTIPWQPSRKSQMQTLASSSESETKYPRGQAGRRTSARQQQSNCSCFVLVGTRRIWPIWRFALVGLVFFPYQQGSRRNHQRQSCQSQDYGCNQNHRTLGPGDYHKKRCQHACPCQSEEHDRVGRPSQPSKHNGDDRTRRNEKRYDQCRCQVLISSADVSGLQLISLG